jgi:hypothetical protein
MRVTTKRHIQTTLGLLVSANNYHSFGFRARSKLSSAPPLLILQTDKDLQITITTIHQHSNLRELLLLC